MVKSFLKKWWNDLKYEPGDPRQLAGGRIKIAAIGGGTGLSTLLRGLRDYSNDISAIVSVADNGSSSGELRKEFDILPPGDIRQCISALAYDEELVSDLLEYRFKKGNNSFSGHTLGNIWITGLTEYFGSFEKALEITTELFKTAGKVMPATLDDIDIQIEYEDGSTLKGETYLDEVLKKINKISLNKENPRAYSGAIKALGDADLIIIGPGSLYGSLLPNLLIPGIKKAILNNKKAVKVYVANCSTERTQTRDYSIDDHIKVINNHTLEKLFDYCLVNDKVIKSSKEQSKLGEVNNITTNKEEIDGIKIVKDDIINEKNPLYHDSAKLAESIINLYKEARK
ncbi:MAG: YvcK family protein [Patescibacteria group bacterium]|nr:YvcK family protein [Patescibacteria group bacterium]